MIDNNFSTKYRPNCFADVVGQEIPKNVLKRIAAADGISVRACTLQGSYGSGKTTLARIFGKALNCSHFKQNGDVCCDCQGCLDAISPSSQTYIEVNSANGGIDGIRSLIDRLNYAPPKDSRRLVVFDEVHTYGAAAVTTLLKVVEEGIPNTMFMFCTTETPSSNIMKALWSRCVNLDITTVAFDDCNKFLQSIASKENIDLPENISRLIYTKSDGHMRSAVSLLQLYKMSGSDSLVDLEPLLNKFFLACFSKARDTALTTLTQITHYPLVEVRVGLYNYIRSIFTSPDPTKQRMNKAQLGTKLFGFFFTPTSQSALSSEVGTELLFQSFIDKTCPLE